MSTKQQRIGNGARARLNQPEWDLVNVRGLALFNSRDRNAICTRIVSESNEQQTEQQAIRTFLDMCAEADAHPLPDRPMFAVPSDRGGRILQAVRVVAVDKFGVALIRCPFPPVGQWFVCHTGDQYIFADATYLARFAAIAALVPAQGVLDLEEILANSADELAECLSSMQSLDTNMPGLSQEFRQ